MPSITHTTTTYTNSGALIGFFPTSCIFVNTIFLV